MRHSYVDAVLVCRCCKINGVNVLRSWMVVLDGLFAAFSYVEGVSPYSALVYVMCSIFQVPRIQTILADNQNYLGMTDQAILLNGYDRSPDCVQSFNMLF
jgi:hypothetical protein